MNLFKRCLLSPYCVLGTESCRKKAQALPVRGYT